MIQTIEAMKEVRLELSKLSEKFLAELKEFTPHLSGELVIDNGGEHYADPCFEGECNELEETYDNLFVEVILEESWELAEMGDGRSYVPTHYAEVFIFTVEQWEYLETLRSSLKLIEDLKSLHKVIERITYYGDFMGDTFEKYTFSSGDVWTISRGSYRPLLRYFSHSTIAKYCMNIKEKSPWLKRRIHESEFQYRGFDIEICTFTTNQFSNSADTIRRVVIFGGAHANTGCSKEIRAKKRELLPSGELASIFLEANYYGESITVSMDRALIQAGLV
jgi:hypothetical protein